MIVSDAYEPADSGTLPLTGERTVPGIPHENYWFRRHEVVYDWVAPRVAGRRVLEIGCGEGYGTALLAASAAHVIGLDYDAATVSHAARRYAEPVFVRGNLAALPLPDASVDAVVTLQVVEHVWDHGQFVRECLRVLRPGGELVMSTPNRLTFSPGRDTPLNPFHTHEFTSDELAALLSRNGAVVDRLLGLHAGATLRELDARWSGSFVDAQLAAPPAEWSPALAADVAAVGVEDFDITADRLAESLDLVVVASRPTG